MHPNSFTLHFGGGAERTIELAQGMDPTDMLSMLDDARRTGRSVTLQVVDGESRALMLYAVDGPSIEAISYVISSGDVLHSFLDEDDLPEPHKSGPEPLRSASSTDDLDATIPDQTAPSPTSACVSNSDSTPETYGFCPRCGTRHRRFVLPPPQQVSTPSEEVWPSALGHAAAAAESPTAPAEVSPVGDHAVDADSEQTGYTSPAFIIPMVIVVAIVIIVISISSR